MTELPQALELLPADWERALCVPAHPDDMEYGVASAVARWRGQGKSVAYSLVTSGEAPGRAVLRDGTRTGHGS